MQVVLNCVGVSRLVKVKLHPKSILKILPAQNLNQIFMQMTNSNDEENVKFHVHIFVLNL